MKLKIDSQNKNSVEQRRERLVKVVEEVVRQKEMENEPRKPRLQFFTPLKWIVKNIRL